MALIFESIYAFLNSTKKMCFMFWMCYQERKVKKEYTALASAPVDPGHRIHYMRPDRYAPRLLSNCKQGLFWMQRNL